MTAVNFAQPVTSDTRANVLLYIRNYMDAQAKLFDGDTLTSPPTNAIRYSAANSRFEKWNGSAWAALTLALLPLAGGTMTGTLTGAAGTFTSLSVAGSAVWHSGNFTPGSYLPLSGGTMSGSLYSGHIWPAATNTYNLGDDTLRYANIISNNFIEAGTALSAKYALSGHSHSYLPLTGGTLSGTLTGAGGSFTSLTISGSGVWHSGNFTPGSYSLTSHTHSYLPLAGGTMSGTLTGAGGTFTSLSRSGANVVTSSNGTPNITRGTAAPSGGSDGDFYAQYV